MTAAVHDPRLMLGALLLGIALVVYGHRWHLPKPAAVRHRAAFLLIGAVVLPVLLGVWLTDCWRARKAIPRWLYCHRPWLWVLNIAEKRARRRFGMARNHPERIAYFYRKGPWRELQKRLRPSGEYVDEIETDMRQRGWKLP